MATKQKQLPGMDQTVNDELAGAIEELKRIDAEVSELKEERAKSAERVAIEMKKVGKDYLRIQLDGHFWDIELTKTEEKLKIKKAKF